MSDGRYTVAEAARRVKRTRRTIERWIEGGLPVVWWSGVRYIPHDALLAEMRRREIADPVKARAVGLEQRRERRVRSHLVRKATAKPQIRM